MVAKAAPSSNLVDEFQRLSTLNNQGILSDEEFTAATAKLLGTA